MKTKTFNNKESKPSSLKDSTSYIEQSVMDLQSKLFTSENTIVLNISEKYKSEPGKANLKGVHPSIPDDSMG